MEHLRKNVFLEWKKNLWNTTVITSVNYINAWLGTHIDN